MSREKQIESTDWLTRDIPKEQLEREKQEAIMSADLELCHTEFITGIYTDYDTIAQKMFAKGWRKQSEGVWVKKHRHRGGYETVTGVDSIGIRHTITLVTRCEYDDLYCSICGKQAADNFLNYCPNCGAKMKGGE